MTTDRHLGFAILLASQPGIGPRRLSDLLAGPGPERGWREAGGDPQIDAEQVVAVHRAAGVRAMLIDDPAYPERLRSDLEPPAVLFAVGDLGAIRAPLVAIVGTRRGTGSGAGVARELGRELTEAGVAIVSGLALGIDGAAHRGVLDARGAPVGVVGSGLDVVYPARHDELWGQVKAQGVLLGEAGLGVRPAPWRFPARNRIIAALADVLVVVESHAAGGSMHTVHEAIERDRLVMAVPGSVRNSSSAGTNQLIAEGCPPVRDATDVLVALGLGAAERAGIADSRPVPTPIAEAVLAGFDGEPSTLENLLLRTRVPLPDLALALEALLATGWVERTGGWYEPVAR